MKLPAKVPANMTARSAAIHIGRMVFDEASRNGGNKLKAAERVLPKLSEEWLALVLPWLIVQCEPLAFREARPVVEGGRRSSAPQPPPAPSPSADTEAEEEASGGANEIQEPIVGVPPGRRASFFSRPGGELDFMHHLPGVGRKRLEDTTGLEWRMAAGYWKRQEETFREKSRRCGSVARAVGDHRTLGEAWEDLSARVRQHVRREAGCRDAEA